MMTACRSSDLHLSTLSGQITGNVLLTGVCSSRTAFGSGFAWFKKQNSYASVWYCSDKVLLLPAVSDLFYECEGLVSRDRTTLQNATNMASSPSCHSGDFHSWAALWCHLSLLLINPAQQISFARISACAWPILSPRPAQEPRNDSDCKGGLRDAQLDLTETGSTRLVCSF